MPDDVLSHEDFAPHVGTTFSIMEQDRRVDALLSEVNPMAKYAAAAAFRTPFSLFFQTREQHVLPQGIYRLSHDAMGDLDIFIVPVARDAAGVTYEAAFN